MVKWSKQVRVIAAVWILLWSLPLFGQQGTVIIRDKDSNTQADVGVAGAVTPNVLGVQGNANGVPLPVSISGAVTTSSCGATTNKCIVDIALINAASISLGAKPAANSFPIAFPTDAGVTILGTYTSASGVISSNMNATVSTQLIAGTASNYIYVSSCRVINNSITVSTAIYLEDGQNGNVIDELQAPAGTTATTGTAGSLPTYPIFPLKVPTAGNGLFARNATTGSSTNIACNGAKSTESK